MEANPGLEAKTLFEALQRKHPGEFQRRAVADAAAADQALAGAGGPGQEVFFAQVHEPGRLGQSDFTHMTNWAITIAGQSFRTWSTTSC